MSRDLDKAKPFGKRRDKSARTDISNGKRAALKAAGIGKSTAAEAEAPAGGKTAQASAANSATEPAKIEGSMKLDHHFANQDVEGRCKRDKG